MLVTQLISKLEPLLVSINQCASHQLMPIASLYQFRATIAEVLYYNSTSFVCVLSSFLDPQLAFISQCTYLNSVYYLHQLYSVHSTANYCGLQSIEPTGHVCQLLVQPSINHRAGPNLVTGCSVRKTHFMPRTDFGPIMCNFGKTWAICAIWCNYMLLCYNAFYARIYLLQRCKIVPW